MQASVVRTDTAEKTTQGARWNWGSRPLWQSAVAAWVGQRLLIGALVAAWQALLLTFAPAEFLHIWTVYEGDQYTSIVLFGHHIAPQLAYFYRIWTLFDGIWLASIARYGYQIVPQAAYSPLYPLLMRLTAPLVVFPCLALMAVLGDRYPRAHRLMVALCIAWTIILTRLLASELFVA